MTNDFYAGVLSLLLTSSGLPLSLMQRHALEAGILALHHQPDPVSVTHSPVTDEAFYRPERFNEKPTEESPSILKTATSDSGKLLLKKLADGGFIDHTTMVKALISPVVTVMPNDGPQYRGDMIDRMVAKADELIGGEAPSLESRQEYECPKCRGPIRIMAVSTEAIVYAGNVEQVGELDWINEAPARCCNISGCDWAGTAAEAEMPTIEEIEASSSGEPQIDPRQEVPEMVPPHCETTEAR